MTTLSDLDGTKWTGSCELWLDPLGNEAICSDATLSVEGQTVHYTWSHEGKDHQGRLTLTDDGLEFTDTWHQLAVDPRASHHPGLEFTDTWHQPEVMACPRIDGARGLFQAEGTYGPDNDWGWRLGVFSRTPSGELVVQMTNITPWGEEARAVRIVGRPQ